MSKPSPLENMPLPKVLASMAGQAALFTFWGWILWNLTDQPASGFITLTWWEAGAGVALAAALIALSAGLALAFPRYAEWIVRSQARQYPFLRKRISMGAILVISIGAGVGEEALFRAGLQTLLSAYLPFPLALAIASGLFAAIHFAKPMNSVLIFVIGCLFGGVYWASGSLLTVMIGHAIYDVYALWALQEALHRYGVFHTEAAEPLHDRPANETLPATTKTTGENR